MDSIDSGGTNLAVDLEAYYTAMMNSINDRTIAMDKTIDSILAILLNNPNILNPVLPTATPTPSIPRMTDQFSNNPNVDTNNQMVGGSLLLSLLLNQTNAPVQPNQTLQTPSPPITVPFSQQIGSELTASLLSSSAPFFLSPNLKTPIPRVVRNSASAKKNTKERARNISKTLKLNEKSNKNKNEEICLICEKYIPFEETGESHMMIHHTIFNQPTKCGCCFWVFRDLSTVESHCKQLTNRNGNTEIPLIINNCPPGNQLTPMDSVNQEYKEFLTAIQIGIIHNVKKELAE